MLSLRPAARLMRRTCVQAARPRPLATQNMRVLGGTSVAAREFSQARVHRQIAPPLNIPKWVSENAHKLAPPINNYCVYDESGVTVMIVGGPNQRTDFHINETAEWFYQHKGSMLLRIRDMSNPEWNEAGEARDIYIHEGDMFLLPPNTPHNPVRFKDTVGVVIEQERPEGSLDRLRWYCDACFDVVHEASFHCTDLGTQLKEAVRKFEADEEARKCPTCHSRAETTYDERELREFEEVWRKK